MEYTVYLTPSAVADISVAVDYYNSKSTDLGKRLAQEVDVALILITEMPKAFSLRYKDIRAAKLRSFPFLIYYELNEKGASIRVLRVFNTHQRPFWTL